MKKVLLALLLAGVLTMTAGAAFAAQQQAHINTNSWGQIKGMYR
jgi:hypothetical protein